MKKGIHWEELGVDGRIILEWVVAQYARNLWPDYIWLRTGTSGGFLWKQ